MAEAISYFVAENSDVKKFLRKPDRYVVVNENSRRNTYEFLLDSCKVHIDKAKNSLIGFIFAKSDYGDEKATEAVINDFFSITEAVRIRRGINSDTFANVRW